MDIFKKITIGLLLLALLGCSAFAQRAEEETGNIKENTVENAAASTVENAAGNTVDLSAMTVEELLRLRQEIDAQLLLKGHQIYYFIERGDKGEAVAKLQQRLMELGYYSGNITSKMDSETQKALKLFERANGLQNDGLASQEDQQLLFSAQAISKATPTPRPVITPRPTEAVPAEYAGYTVLDYDDCARYPENYLFKGCTFTGKVVQVLGSRKDGYQIRLALSGEEDVVYLFLNYDPGYGILEGDRLTVYATMTGSVTYTSIWGQEITIPSATVKHLILK